MFKGIRRQAEEMFSEKEQVFQQYMHRGLCKIPCKNCGSYYFRIFDKSGAKPPVGEEKHPHCDCYYSDVEKLLAGLISVKGKLSPDVYLKNYGRLPDYYITKEEAINDYGRNSRRNTMAGVAPGKMIGGIPYENKKHILPEKEGRIWYECDVDYEKGVRNAKRLFYSNDGLMFYSPDHGQEKFYYIAN